MPHKFCDTSPILLVGGGGHCRAVIDVLESASIEIADCIRAERVWLLSIFNITVE